MPTYTFTRTREQMRDMILRKLRAFDPGQSPDADDAIIVYEAMDLRLKELHVLGVLWWQVSGATTNVTLTSGNASASLSAITDFLFPVTLALRVGTDDHEMGIISHREYQAIPDKADTGEPVKAFFDLAASTVRVWPTPDANYTAKLTYQAIAADTAGSTAPDLRVEAMRAFAQVVAGDLVDDFHVPEARAQRLIAQQEPALRYLRTLNTERVGNSTVEMTSY